MVTPHEVVELYPRAAVLTAWFNAWSADAVDGLGDCPAARADDPVHTGEVTLPGWEPHRLPLGLALATVLGTPATCALPVPGDAAGLPPAAVRALAAGQAMVLTGAEAAFALVPTSAGTERTVWHATSIPVRAPAEPPGPSDIRSRRLLIMELMSDAMAIAQRAAPTTRPDGADAELRRTLHHLSHVPMPPGSAGAAVELARSSASLLAIVSTAVATLPATEESHEIRDALRPLGRAARESLAIAFSAAGGGVPDRRREARP